MVARPGPLANAVVKKAANHPGRQPFPIVPEDRHRTGIIPLAAFARTGDRRAKARHGRSFVPDRPEARKSTPGRKPKQNDAGRHNPDAVVP